MGVRKRPFCSAVPNAMIAGAMFETPITFTGPGACTRFISSRYTSCSLTPASRPPCSAGHDGAAHPPSASVRFRRAGPRGRTLAVAMARPDHLVAQVLAQPRPQLVAEPVQRRSPLIAPHAGPVSSPVPAPMPRTPGCHTVRPECPSSCRRRGSTAMGQEEGTSVTVEITPRNVYFAKDCPERRPARRPATLRAPARSAVLAEALPRWRRVRGGRLRHAVPRRRGGHRRSGGRSGIHEVLTTQALAGRATIVAGGRLPVDDEAHRVGEPDLLVLDGDRRRACVSAGRRQVAQGARPGPGAGRRGRPWCRS